jgi:signal transduction histidine kinase
VWDLESLEMPWGEWLSLQFAVLDYSVDRRHRYQYRLGGVDEDWIDLGSSREITFTHLDPGIYEFDVRGRNSQGVWSVADPTLRIEIVPPFWMTAWFRVLTAAAVILLVVTGHRIRIAAMKKRNRELMEFHEQRERARIELIQAYDRLRRVTRRLEVAKEDERKRIARELHDEMGQALTAVKINLRLVPKDSVPDEVHRQIRDTVNLVDEIIRQVRDLSLDLSPPLLDEMGLIPALNGYLESLAPRAGIAIDIDEDPEIARLSPEVEITVFRVVQEAVTNVIRHARATRVVITLRQGVDRIELAVRDDGCGFDVHDVLERSAAGDHLGLFGIRERVRMLGGEVEIESTDGRGTEVRARIPRGAS